MLMTLSVVVSEAKHSQSAQFSTLTVTLLMQLNKMFRKSLLVVTLLALTAFVSAAADNEANAAAAADNEVKESKARVLVSKQIQNR